MIIRKCAAFWLLAATGKNQKNIKLTLTRAVTGGDLHYCSLISSFFIILYCNSVEHLNWFTFTFPVYHDLTTLIQINGVLNCSWKSLEIFVQPIQFWGNFIWRLVAHGCISRSFGCKSLQSWLHVWSDNPEFFIRMLSWIRVSALWFSSSRVGVGGLFISI